MQKQKSVEKNSKKNLTKRKNELETRDSDGYIILELADGLEFARNKKGQVVIRKAKKTEDDTDEIPVINTVEAYIGNYVMEKEITAAANVNIGRALPWLEDGLKFVERRVLYTMFKAGWTPKNPKVRISSIVGRMIETVYPHGDMPPSLTIYRLGRKFQSMIPYIESGGGYGNAIDMKGAAPRYAHARLSQYAMDCFFHEEDAISPVYDTKETYTQTDVEPIYLATRFPNILMQWNFGIGNGAATTFAAFNPAEIFDATLKLMDNPEAKIDIYPDAPLPIDIVNKSELKHCFDKKSFKVKVQGQYYVDTMKAKDRNGKTYDANIVVFTSCPMQTKGALIAEQIRRIKKQDETKGQESKILPEVIDFHASIKNGSENGGDLTFIIEYESGYDPHALAKKLIKSTSFGMTYGANYTVAHDYQPKQYTPREILLEWVKTRLDQKRRYFIQKKKLASREKARAKSLIIIIENKKVGGLDKAIEIIKHSDTDDNVCSALQKEFGLTEFQARVVMEIRLKALSRTNLDKERQNYKKACDEYDLYTSLCNDDAVREAIKEDLRYGKKKYGIPRRAKLYDENDRSADANEEKIIIYSRKDFYCLKSYDEITSIAKNIDRTYKVITVKNSDNLVLFTGKGKMKILNGYAFSYTNASISMEKVAVDDVTSILIAKDISGLDLAFITKFGFGKIMKFKELSKSIKGKVISLGDDDELVDVIPVGSDGIVGMIDNDKIYYVKLDSIPNLKRSAYGNRLIKTTDTINISAAMYTDKIVPYILIYGESGYIKLLDTNYLGFNKKGSNYISMKDKLVYGITPLHGIESKIWIYTSKGVSEVTVTVGSKILFESTDGIKRSFPQSTSIGNPVKLLQVGKREFYEIL